MNIHFSYGWGIFPIHPKRIIFKINLPSIVYFTYHFTLSFIVLFPPVTMFGK